MKKAVISLAALTLSVLPPPGAAAERNDFVIVPGVRVGPIHAGATRADLRGLFPDSTIEESELELDEGLVFPATMIARSAPGESLAIIWTGKGADAHPKQVYVCRGRRRGACSYHIVTAGSQVAVGVTRLSDLEALNGGPVTVNGFGWTYGGNVLSWEGGKIAKLDCNGSLSLVVDGERNRDGELTADLTAAEKESFEGNRPVSSATPALRKLNPAVTEILFIFPAPDAGPCAN